MPTAWSPPQGVGGKIGVLDIPANSLVHVNSAGATERIADVAAAKILIAQGTTSTPTWNSVSGDITLSNAGVAAIASGVIVNADIKSDAAIAISKLAISGTKYFHYDEMFYNTDADLPYDSEGSGFDESGGPGVIQMNSGAGAGNRARINTGVAKLIFNPAEQLMKVRSSLSNLTNAHHFIGLFSALPSGAVPPLEPAEGIYFRVRNTGSAANWFAVSRKASSETAVDTGVLPTTQMQLFEIIVTATEHIYSINGTVVATIDTNITTTFLLWGIIAVTQIASIKGLRIDMLLLAGKR